ncbi:DUF4113 domain-containing protein, partial [Klebsiella pneumoniae]
DVTLKMPAFEWVHVQLHQQKGMISLSPPTICNSAVLDGINNSGLGKVWFAGRGIAPEWPMKREMPSSAYTTRWKELPVARF